MKHAQPTSMHLNTQSTYHQLPKNQPPKPTPPTKGPTASKQESAKKPVPLVSNGQKSRALGAIKGVTTPQETSQKPSTNGDQVPPLLPMNATASLSGLEDLPVEKESPYFADMDVDSFDALSASLTVHNDKRLERTASVD